MAEQVLDWSTDVAMQGPAQSGADKLKRNSCKRSTNITAAANPQKQRSFAFIAAQTDGRAPSDSRRLIRSHVMRGKNTGKRNQTASVSPQPASPPHQPRQSLPTHYDDLVDLSSGDSSSPDEDDDEGDGGVERNATSTLRISSTATVTIVRPSKIGQDPKQIIIHTACMPGPLICPPGMYRLHFAEAMDEESQRSLQTFFMLANEAFMSALSPPDLCGKTKERQDHWWQWLLRDPAYLNSALFNIGAFIDIIDFCEKHNAAVPGSSVMFPTSIFEAFSPKTWGYLRRTIKLLQDRIEDPEEQLSVSTAAVVLSLAMTAELIGDDSAFESHVAGLVRIVRLRGGIETFDDFRLMQTKICRVDLGWALKTGRKPQLRPDIDWAPCTVGILESQSLGHLATPSGIDSLLHPLDTSIYDIFTDVRNLSLLIDHHRSINSYLNPRIFQDTVLSVRYRLLLFDYNRSAAHILQEAIRVSLLTYDFTFYRSTPGIQRPFEDFSRQLQESVEALDGYGGPMITDLMLWMLFIGAMVVLNVKEKWVATRLIQMTAGMRWHEVEERLKGVIWVDYLHQKRGKDIFDAVRGMAVQ
ncbi:hypothetical protein S40293_05694 [Stachybotrys chartarum IBT 40293]|nr:hypothetical protein S40293_05694 [Stachybotrys chartarum IBT 40293]